MQAIYRLVVMFQLILLVLSYFFPWGFAYGNGSDEALQWKGVNSLINLDAIIIYSILISILYAICYVGLLLFQRWARVLLVFISIFGGVAIFFQGISVASNYEGMIGFYASLADGFIIALSFFSEIKQRFNKR
jgi:hypothetical protein